MKIDAIVPPIALKILNDKEAQITTRAPEVFLLFKDNIFIFYLPPYLLTLEAIHC